MAEAERSAIFSKEMAFVLPLVGTAVSVAYDVGYFSALNNGGMDVRPRSRAGRSSLLNVKIFQSRWYRTGLIWQIQ